jgi:hypothetical protein
MAGFARGRCLSRSQPLEIAMSPPGSLSRALALLLSTVLLPALAGAQSLPAKAPGTMRIGIVQPRVQMSGADAAQSAEAVRNILAGYLQGPTIEVALLGARLPSQYRVEARQADCDFVLSTTLLHKRGGAAGAGSRALGALSGYAPYVPGADYAKAAIVTTVLQTAQDFAATIKARDDMSLAVKLETPDGGKPLIDTTQKRKAKSDGEDLLTPLVEGAAEAVGGAIAGR